MRKALFLDRDGIINEDGSYLYRPEDFRFMDGIFELCRAAQEKGYLLIVTTNQSGIARGYYTEEDFLKLTDWMCREFAKEDIRIDKVYFCPFHPEKGIGAYKVDSDDRKPNPGMLLKARDEFGIDMEASVMVGDKDSDMEAGRRAGVKKLLLYPGMYECETEDDVVVLSSLREAIPLL